MTPERAMMYSQLITGVLSMQNVVVNKNGIWHESAVTDLLRQAVNEALSDASKIVGECRVLVTEEHPIAVARETSQSLAMQIDALKLPEEP